MKNKELFSFILVYFAILAFVNCSETVEVKKNETIVIPTAEIKANLTTSTTPNITVSSSTTTTTTTVAPETEKPKKITGKKFAPTTLPPPTNTTLAPVPIKQNSTNAQIFTEGGPINVPGVKENSTAQVSTTSSSSTNTSSSSTTLSTTTTKATSTTTTTTTTSTTTTTTTPKPKKPTITFSDEEQPDVVPNEKSTTNHNNGLPVPSNHEVEEPHAQPSKEQFNPHRDFVVPLVTFIFALPIFLGIAVIGYRKVRDYWSTRHYRRMDFLVDGMYND